MNNIHNPIDQVITHRHSVRAFLPQMIPQNQLKTIFEVASRAPSGTNTQPWKVYVLVGEQKNRLSEAILSALQDPDHDRLYQEEYDYYPKEWVSPFVDRRRALGWEMYGLLGITKGDKDKMFAQHARNFKFFDAPVGIIYTIPRVMGRGSWLDYGMFIQNVMLAAKGRGIDTCAQAAFNQYHTIIASLLAIPDDEMVVCGMAMGYADETAIVNTLISAREPVESFVTFMGAVD